MLPVASGWRATNRDYMQWVDYLDESILFLDHNILAANHDKLRVRDGVLVPI
jgi:hypothetical protein